jgi:hypothetical protein
MESHEKTSVVGHFVAGGGDIVQMMAQLQVLGIDAVKDSQFLWIAEEYLIAPLPVSWSQHHDDVGTPYYYNQGTGESTWVHPLEEVFATAVVHQRQALDDGGFWNIDDHLAELEDHAREDLQHWMEIHDAHGVQLFYNKQTEQCTYADPRLAQYNTLYARIKLVAMMKQKFPVLARAPRPDPVQPWEVAMKLACELEEKRFLGLVVKLQARCRALVARHRAKKLREHKENLDRARVVPGLRLHMVKEIWFSP